MIKRVLTGRIGAGLGAAALAGLALQGCAEKPKTAQHVGLPVYQNDLEGGAKECMVSKPSPVPGQTSPVTMTVANDGGWCAVSASQDGPAPYSAGLVTARPAHGDVLVHGVGDETRIDYTPDRGFTGSDAFAVKLMPGAAVLQLAVTVTPGPASAAPPPPPAPEKAPVKKRK